LALVESTNFVGQQSLQERRITKASTGTAVGACPDITAHWPPPSDAKR